MKLTTPLINTDSLDVMGFPVANFNMLTLSREIQEALLSHRSNVVWAACLNVHSYVLAQQDKDFSAALRACNWLLPDGAGIVFAGRILVGQIAERVTGLTLFEQVMYELNRMEGRVFFLGSTSETLNKIRDRVVCDYPSITVCGVYSPSFTTEFNPGELSAMTAAVNAAQPHVLWVGLTAPKQEKLLQTLAPALRVQFAGAIGAVFDFYAGNVRVAPPLFRRFGLEWLYRFSQEPSRLWRRPFQSIPRFLIDLTIHLARRLASIRD